MLGARPKRKHVKPMLKTASVKRRRSLSWIRSLACLMSFDLDSESSLRATPSSARERDSTLPSCASAATFLLEGISGLYSEVLDLTRSAAGPTAQEIACVKNAAHGEHTNEATRDALRGRILGSVHPILLVCLFVCLGMNLWLNTEVITTAAGRSAAQWKAHDGESPSATVCAIVCQHGALQNSEDKDSEREAGNSDCSVFLNIIDFWLFLKVFTSGGS